MSARRPLSACDIRRKVDRRGAKGFAVAAGVCALWLILPAAGAGSSTERGAHGASRAPQGAPRAQAREHAARQDHAAEEPHGGGVWDLAARLVNFAVLAGTLVYLLRSPLVSYLTNRGAQIRHDLAVAQEMRQSATEQLAEIDRRLKALPAEIDGLRARGAEEIAAEEARIREVAEAERQRLLEQTRREIEMQLRIAERELVSHAAQLAVGAAAERIQQGITPEDQTRLVDRYLAQVRGDR